MATFLTIIGVLTAVITVYVVWLRKWLKTKSWAQGFFNLVEPIEIALYRKSETIFFARLKIAIGIILTALTSIGTIDLSPFMPLVPDKWEGYIRAAFGLLPLVISLMGWIDERLRIDTTKPIEFLALPPTALPATKAAVAEAEVAISVAVAAAANDPTVKS